MNCAYCNNDLGDWPEERVEDVDDLGAIQVVKWTWTEGPGHAKAEYYCDPECLVNEVSGE